MANRTKQRQTEEERLTLEARQRRVADLNARLAARHREVRDAYDRKPIRWEGRGDPHKVAAALSAAFLRVGVCVVYEGGAPVVYAHPLLGAPIVGAGDQALLELEEEVASYWPAFAEITAFARGYGAGAASRDEEVAELRRRLREAEVRGGDNPFPRGVFLVPPFGR